MTLSAHDVAVLAKEMQETAEDEANGITDIPVDDLLNKAAQYLIQMWDMVRAYQNDAAGNEAMMDGLRKAVTAAKEETEYVKDAADAILSDLDCALEHLRECGVTKWMDAKGIWRPIPIPARLILGDPTSPVPPKPTWFTEDVVEEASKWESYAYPISPTYKKISFKDITAT